MGEDGGRDGVRAQVLVATGPELVSEVDDGGASAGELERCLDRPLARLLEALAGAHGGQKLVEGDGVALDEVLGVEPHGLRLRVRLAGARPGRGPDRDLLQQRGRRGQGRRRGRAAGGRGRAGRDLAQQVTESRPCLRIRTRQSPPSVWS
jgi:hypothetical protein